MTILSPLAGSHGSGWLAVIGIFVPPVVATVSLFAIARLFGVDQPYSVLATLGFIITLVVYRDGRRCLTFARRPQIFYNARSALGRSSASCLALLGFALQYGGGVLARTASDLGSDHAVIDRAFSSSGHTCFSCRMPCVPGMP